LVYQKGTGIRLQALAKETAAVSLAYLVAFYMAFEILMPVQNAFFPEFASSASLLFLPHGVRVLSAWLLGWRSAVALAPGVFLAFFQVAGAGVFEPSRMIGILIAITVPAATFHAFQLLRWRISPQPGRTPCWSCIMAAGVAVSVLGSSLTNYAFGSAPKDYVAYLVGDIFGLYFLMLILMFVFRVLRSRGR
jgi:hypothetical protein